MERTRAIPGFRRWVTDRTCSDRQYLKYGDALGEQKTTFFLKLLLIQSCFFRTSRNENPFYSLCAINPMSKSTLLFGFRAFWFVTFLQIGTIDLFAAQKFPYIAQITDSEAAVYSSPGTEQYETQKLKAGDKVQVFQVNSDGWCAIRPPVGSFSWVSGLYVQAGLDNVGTVTVDQLSSRIGSQFGDTCKTVQVQLKKGERVTLLERVETPTNSASPVWYKIVPPAGEFRWIPLESISTSPKLAKQNKANTGRIVQVAHDEEIVAGPDLELIDGTQQDEMMVAEKSDFNDATLNIPENEAVLAELADSDPLESPNSSARARTPQSSRPSPRLASNVANPPVRQGQVVSGQQYIIEQPNGSTILNPTIYEPQVAYRNNAMTPQHPMGMEPTDPYQRALAQLNREIHASLNRPTDDWMFDAMIQKGKQMVERAPTEYDRTRAIQMVQTLERSRAIRKSNAFRREHISNLNGGKMTPSVVRNNANLPQQNTAPPTNPGLPTLPTTGLAPSTPAPNLMSNVMMPSAVNPPVAQASNQQHSPFKAKGRLGWFSQRPEGYPPFALVNEQGQIVSYVTPQPGVDLKPYINKQVGINGTSGVYINGNQRAPHLEASVVFPLQ